MQPKIRYGMVGGGPGGNIGQVHRFAARMDEDYELVCGAFSRDFAKSKLLADELGLNQQRIYETYTDLFANEVKLPATERMQVVTIVTPNYLHYPIAKIALEHGFHVICEKPMTCTVEEAEALKKLTTEKNLLLCVTYTKAGYPMIKEARSIIAAGKLGKVRKVFIDFRQGWLATRIEEKNKQAKWRVDPKQSGPTGTLADIGSHAFHLAEYVSGLAISELCADMNVILMGRQLDDDNTILVKFNNGASGAIIATQIATGEEENITVSIYGEIGSLKWHIQSPNYLQLYWHNKPMEILRSGVDNALFSELTLGSGRIPGGHDEGHIEAFANHYRCFAKAIRDHATGKTINPPTYDYPSVTDGLRGMQLIATALHSQAKRTWVKVK